MKSAASRRPVRWTQKNDCDGPHKKDTREKSFAQEECHSPKDLSEPFSHKYVKLGYGRDEFQIGSVNGLTNSHLNCKIGIWFTYLAQHQH